MAPAAARLQRTVMAAREAPEVVRIGERSGSGRPGPAVSVVVPLYRNLRFLRHQYAAFARDPLMRDGAELVYVLDSPEQRDDLEHLLRGLHGVCGMPVRLVVQAANYGYASACNAGAAVAEAPVLAMVNSDVVPAARGWLRPLLGELDALSAGGRPAAVGPKLLFEDGSLQHAGLFFESGPGGEWYNTHYWKGFPRFHPPAQRGREVPGVTGALLCLRRAEFEALGGFCTDYVVGDYEDSDLCLRLRAAGGRVRYVPEAELYHFERQSIRDHGGYARTAACNYNRLLAPRALGNGDRGADGALPRPRARPGGVRAMRILHLCHNHPDLQPGGTEVLARGLFRELRDRHGCEGLFLAAVTGAHRPRRPGTLLQSVGGAADEMLVWLGHFDRFAMAQPDTYGLASLLPLVAGLDPEIVHVHHLLLFGAEGLDAIRRAAPRARLVFTAHDFFPLCPQEGQLLTTDGRLCRGPSLDGCHRCFPGRPGDDFVMRDLQMRDLLADFDRILLPSAFARGRYLAAGWPADRLQVMPNGVRDAGPGAAPVPPRPRAAATGAATGSASSATSTASRAPPCCSKRRASFPRRASGTTSPCTGARPTSRTPFWRRFNDALLAAPAARHQGAYAADDLPALMAAIDWVVMPSIWWENAPLVILEAFRHRRPVICGGIGGMAEMVRDGVDGLHAPVGDPVGLAACMRRAAADPALWHRLAAAIEPPMTIAQVADRHLSLYQELLGGSQPEPGATVATPMMAA